MAKQQQTKSLEARVKADYQFKVVRAFNGHEYTKREWRPVPEGQEAEAERLTETLLDVREVGGQDSEAAKAAKPEQEATTTDKATKAKAEDADGNKASGATQQRSSSRK